MAASIGCVNIMTPEAQLRAHLLTHMDAETADFLIWWIRDQFPAEETRPKGSKKPHWLDSEIERSWGKIEAHHTGRAKLSATAYWAEYFRHARFCEMRTATRERGRPRNTSREGLMLLLNDLYPPDFPRKSRLGPFQHTFRLACEFADILLPPAIANTEKNYTNADIVHEVVVDALAGITPPPDTPLDVEAAYLAWRKKATPPVMS